MSTFGSPLQIFGERVTRNEETNYLERKLSQVRNVGLSHFNRVEVATIIIVVFTLLQSRHGWLTFQVVVIICPCRLVELRIVSRQPLTFGHDVKEEMESVSERLGADAPAV